MTAQTRTFAGALCLLACLMVLTGCAMKAEFPLAPAEGRIITVSQWGGTPAEESTARRHAITRITLHHQGVDFPRGGDPARYLRNLQNWSRHTQNWLEPLCH